MSPVERKLGSRVAGKHLSCIDLLNLNYVTVVLFWFFIVVVVNLTHLDIFGKREPGITELYKMGV